MGRWRRSARCRRGALVAAIFRFNRSTLLIIGRSCSACSVTPRSCAQVKVNFAILSRFRSLRHRRGLFRERHGAAIARPVKWRARSHSLDRRRGRVVLLTTRSAMGPCFWRKIAPFSVRAGCSAGRAVLPSRRWWFCPPCWRPGRGRASGEIGRSAAGEALRFATPLPEWTWKAAARGQHLRCRNIRPPVQPSPRRQPGRNSSRRHAVRAQGERRSEAVSANQAEFDRRCAVAT